MTVTRANNFDNGMVVDSPPFVVEYILRTHLGLSTDRIDYESFDTCSTAMPATMKVNTSIVEERPALEAIGQICGEFNFQVFLNAEGKYKAVNMGSGSGNATITISNSDIASDRGRGRITVSRTPIEAVKNQIFLNYRQDFFTGQSFYKQKYIGVIKDSVSATTNLTNEAGALRQTNYSNWLQESREKYLSDQVLDINLEFVHDDTTAEDILKRFSDWLAFRRLVVNTQLLRNSTTMTIEVGDLVKFQNALLGTLHADIADFMVTRVYYPGFGVSPSPFIEIEAQEVPFSRTGTTLDSSTPYEE